MVALGLLFLPTLDVAIALMQRLVAWRVGPRRLPRLDFTDGIPDEARTMVIVPTLLSSTERSRACSSIWRSWRRGISIRDIHFAILGDFTDAVTATQRTTTRFSPPRPKAFSI